MVLFAAPSAFAADAISLTPETAENPRYTRHTVTATVTDGGEPVAGVNTIFYVTDGLTLDFNDPNYDIDGDGANDVYLFHFATTDGDGKASGSYIGPKLGTDTTESCADENSNNLCEETEEPVANAEKIWAPNSIALSPATAENP